MITYTQVNVGNKLRHNTFRHIRPQGQEGVAGNNANAQAIYLDDVMSNWVIENNSIVDCDRGIAISGKYNRIINNSFIHTDMPISGGVRGSENSNCSVSRAFPSWKRSILTEIYLCHACSCFKIWRMETPGVGLSPCTSAGFRRRALTVRPASAASVHHAVHPGGCALHSARTRRGSMAEAVSSHGQPERA
jgi:parallel beta-helix repeat protein